MYARFGLAALVFGLFSAGIPAGAQESITYQINTEHTGATKFRRGLNLPLQRVWSRTFSDGDFLVYPTRVSYPVIADGKVFVLVAAYSPNQSMTLVALSLATGETLWSKDAGELLRSGPGGLAFDNGRLFVVCSGSVQALDPETGTAFWTTPITDQYYFSSPPTASDGVVYLSGSGGGGALYALNEVTGEIVWRQSVQNGDVSSPTVTAAGIFVTYPCEAYKFSLTGTLIWNYSSGCSGGGGFTAPLYSGRLYTRLFQEEADPIWTFGANNGTRHEIAVDKSILRQPAFANSTGYFASTDRLIAWDVETGRNIWEFTGALAPALPPIVVNDKVVVVSNGGDLFVLDGQSGAELQNITLGAEIPVNAENGASLRNGMAAGEGVLIVPAGDTLSAFKSAQ